MITLVIQKHGDSRCICSTDAEHLALGRWLTHDLGRTGGGGIAQELFEEIEAVRSDRKEHSETWGELTRVKINRTGATIEPKPSTLGPACTLSLDELVDATLQWFDTVNPDVARELRQIQSER